MLCVFLTQALCLGSLWVWGLNVPLVYYHYTAVLASNAQCDMACHALEGAAKDSHDVEHLSYDNIRHARSAFAVAAV